MLLLRGLDMTTEAETVRDRVGEEISRLAARDAANPVTITDGRGAVQRVVLIRDRHNKLARGYGFVELATPEMASALLAHLLSREAQPTGFVVDGQPVAASFAKSGAFEPFALDAGEEGAAVLDAEAAQAQAQSQALGTPWLIAGGGGGGIGGGVGWYRYADDRHGASELVVHPGHGGVLPDPALYAYMATIAAPTQPAAAPSGSDKKKDTGLLGGKMQPVKIGLGGKKKAENVLVSLSVADKDKGESGAGGSAVWRRRRDGDTHQALPFAVTNLLGDDDEEADEADTVLASRSESYVFHFRLRPVTLIPYLYAAVGKHIVPSMMGSRKVKTQSHPATTILAIWSVVCPPSTVYSFPSFPSGAPRWISPRIRP